MRAQRENLPLRFRKQTDFAQDFSILTGEKIFATFESTISFTTARTTPFCAESEKRLRVKTGAGGRAEEETVTDCGRDSVG